MIRSELIERLAADNPDLRPAEIDAIVGSVFDAIVGALAEGRRVELRGFGSFSVRARDGREGRNPRTGAPVTVPPKNVLYFKPGKDMRARINGG